MQGVQWTANKAEASFQGAALQVINLSGELKAAELELVEKTELDNGLVDKNLELAHANQPCD